MIRRLFRPIEIVLPPAWTIATFFLFYLAIEGVMWLAAGYLFRPAVQFEPPHVEPFLRMRTALCTAGALLFALWRVLALHPIVRWDYRQWLAQTPWTPRMPLPMGPVWPGAADGVILAAFCWLSGSDLPEGPIAPVFSYSIGLIAATCLLAGLSGQRAVLYLLLFGLGLTVRVAWNVAFPLAVLAGMLPLVYFGLRRSLEPSLWPDFALSLQKFKEYQQQKSWIQLGWPFGFVGPRASPHYLKWIDTVAIAVLTGWFAHAGLAAANPSPYDEQGLVVGGTMLLAFAAVGRAVGLCTTYWSPISLLGRLLTLRWIIPKYDRVFVASLATLLTLGLGHATIAHWEIPGRFGYPVLLAVCVFCLIGIGPTVRNWELTGAHRISSLFYCNKGSQFTRV